MKYIYFNLVILLFYCSCCPKLSPNRTGSLIILESNNTEIKWEKPQLIVNYNSDTSFQKRRFFFTSESDVVKVKSVIRKIPYNFLEFCDNSEVLIFTIDCDIETNDLSNYDELMTALETNCIEYYHELTGFLLNKFSILEEDQIELKIHEDIVILGNVNKIKAINY